MISYERDHASQLASVFLCWRWLASAQKLSRPFFHVAKKFDIEPILVSHARLQCQLMTEGGGTVPVLKFFLVV